MVHEAVIEHFTALKQITDKLNKENEKDREDIKHDHPGNDIEDYTEVMNRIVRLLEQGKDFVITEQ